ncbi:MULTISPECIES: HWE histidine kinase domain-containing protein [Methylobacterium]|uniref:Blue-light-activated histidine kinase n=1 Tax=Methylobacterium bullatum TaxID=570505 RepID=A0AAV4ZCL0_9HYPH|nr:MULTISPECIES: HWE histidine kinase domain-containing protein [Methylobacterium]MBD8904826.1 histidine kinase [Methylobacterium bullatum]TXN25308.1 PAS domain-containing protein [Methylobacterium sp. WL19]GJD41626.1 Blue-light-activated histidine kinase [Methylobacterium bullatum]
MTADTKIPPPGVALARGPPATCEYEASCAHAIETSLGIQGLGVHREHDRIVREIARTVDGTDPFAAVVRASQMAMVITDPLQDDNPIVFANDAFCTLTGYGRDEILGRNCRFLQEADTDPVEIGRLREAIEGRVPVEAQLLNRRKDGSLFWNRIYLSPVFEGDALTYFVASQVDVTSEKARLTRLETDREALEREVERRTRDLSRSEERLRFVLQAGRLGSWSLDLADMRFVASETFKLALGRDPGDPLSRAEYETLIHPDDRARRDVAVAECIAGHGDYDVEYRIVKPTGEVRWLKIRGQPFYGADGAPSRLAGIALDVTERKHAEAHRALLANELNHRVKNTLATVQSIVAQTLRANMSPQETRDVIQGRIHSLAAATDVLTRESWDGATLAAVAATALAPFRTEGDRRITIRGPEVMLTPRLALAFSMAFHELATNAVKYGALTSEVGRILLDWDIIDGLRPETLRLTWRESEGPPVCPPTRRGFGSRMIERALADELQGRAEIDYRPDGVVFIAEARMPDIRRPDQSRSPA